MDKALVEFVWRRADAKCEYCLMPQSRSSAPFEIDHIIACKHGGKTLPANLALSCFYCNSYKGPNIAGIDPETGELTRLFNPRSDLWSEHFAWNGAWLKGRTAIGRTTISVLEINHPEYVVVRESLMAEGLFRQS